VNRRTAIATLLTAVPGMVVADAAARGAVEATKKYKVATFATSPSALSRELILLHENGMIETVLDNLRCLRVSFGGESIDVAAAEIWDALRATPHVHSWHEGPFYLTVASTYEEPTYYPPSAVIGVETCDCGAIRLPGKLGAQAGRNLAGGAR